MVYTGTMWCFAASRLILLALLLASSQLVLAKHSTTHSDNDLLQCVLCLGQSDSKSASAHTESCPNFSAEPAGLADESPVLFLFRDIYQPYHSRAPPFIA